MTLDIYIYTLDLFCTFNIIHAYIYSSINHQDLVYLLIAKFFVLFSIIELYI